LRRQIGKNPFGEFTAAETTLEEECTQAPRQSWGEGGGEAREKEKGTSSLQQNTDARGSEQICGGKLVKRSSSGSPTSVVQKKAHKETKFRGKFGVTRVVED